MVKIFIPRYKKIEADHDNKTYTVYVIQVYMFDQCHTVEKRYSQCEEIHKQLKKVMYTPEFPPKKVLKWNTRVLEQRRHGLESYFQAVVERGNIPDCLSAFLKLSTDDVSLRTQSLENISVGTTHQPVLSFSEEHYLQQNTTKGGLPDIVVHGVLQGLYNSMDYHR